MISSHAIKSALATEDMPSLNTVVERVVVPDLHAFLKELCAGDLGIASNSNSCHLNARLKTQSARPIPAVAADGADFLQQDP